jgi:hypothetical protein
VGLDDLGFGSIEFRGDLRDCHALAAKPSHLLGELDSDGHSRTLPPAAGSRQVLSLTGACLRVGQHCAVAALSIESARAG